MSGNILIKGEITSQQLCTMCIEQITLQNSSLNAVLNIAPKAIILQQAATLHDERAAGKTRSPLHGVPIIIKDIFPTQSSLGLPTTGGSHALRDAYGKRIAEIEYAPGCSRPEGFVSLVRMAQGMLDFMVKYEEIMPGRPAPTAFK